MAALIHLAAKLPLQFALVLDVLLDHLAQSSSRLVPEGGVSRGGSLSAMVAS
jgi:hypothetical protein